MSKYKQGGILSIVYDVWISGTKMGIDKKECINSIEIKETVDGADTATIQITDPEFLYIEDDIFLYLKLLPPKNNLELFQYIVLRNI